MSDITVIHAENAGCYGHNGADDAAFEAALLAMETPTYSVMLKWSRQDEHRCELEVPRETSRVEDGVISSAKTNRVTDYWKLQGGKPFKHIITRMPALKHVGQSR